LGVGVYEYGFHFCHSRGEEKEEEEGNIRFQDCGLEMQLKTTNCK